MITKKEIIKQFIKECPEIEILSEKEMIKFREKMMEEARLDRRRDEKRDKEIIRVYKKVVKNIFEETKSKLGNQYSINYIKWVVMR